MLRTILAAAAATLVAAPAAAQAAPGDIDTSFGWPVGFVSDPGGDIATDVVALPGGGAAVLALDGSLIAYTATGERDAGFGIEGRVELVDTELGSASALVRDPQGRLLAAVREGGASSVIRVTPSGAVDTTFGDGGRTVIRYGLYQDHYVHDLALTPDGRILVGGYAQASGRATAALARLTADGEYDTEFAADGSTTIPGDERNTAFEAIASDGAGGVYAVGTSQSDALFAHVLADGTRDAAFDGDGERTIHTGDAGDRLLPVSVTRQGAGLFATVLRGDSDGERPVVLALDAASGATRTGFGAGGLVAVPHADDVGEIAAGADGGLLVAASGVDEDSVWQRSLVVRLDAATGAPDPRFAGDGVRSLPFDTVQWGTRLVRDAAGRVTIAGQGANRLLTWRVADVAGDVTPSGGGGTPSGNGGVVAPPPSPSAETRPPATPQDAPSQQQPPVGAASAHRPAAWFYRVRSAKRLSGEADQGAARVQVAITQRDGRRCRSVTSTRRARLGSIGACSPTRARWLTAASTPRAGKTQVWSLRLARRLPPGRYTATVRALDREGVAGRIGEISFRVR